MRCPQTKHHHKLRILQPNLIASSDMTLIQWSKTLKADDYPTETAYLGYVRRSVGNSGDPRFYDTREKANSTLLFKACVLASIIYEEHKIFTTLISSPRKVVARLVSHQFKATGSPSNLTCEASMSAKHLSCTFHLVKPLINFSYIFQVILSSFINLISDPAPT